MHKPNRRSGPSLPDLERLLTKSGIQLNGHQLQTLWRYHNLIRKHNDDRELTRIIAFEAVVQKHYVDCMIIGDLMRLPSPLLDIGTGAGFPGIPLKIRFPGIEMILAEPRPKRVAFLNECISELGLKQTKVFDHKVVSQSFNKPVKGVITRALETIDKTVLRTSACLAKGGKLIFMKGPGVDPELEEVMSKFGGGLKLSLDKSYQLPGTPHRRRLIVLEKTVDGDVRHPHRPSNHLQSDEEA